MKTYGFVTYEGQTYKTVVIGTQTWMAENLNYNVTNSKCYDDLTSNCTTYGRLYDWATAMALSTNCNTSSCSPQISTKHKGICPNSWHIPSDADWRTLIGFINPSCSGSNYLQCANAGIKLKATSGWNNDGYNSGNGTDDFGFAALPGGVYFFTNDGYYYSSIGRGGNWIGTKEYNSSNFHYMALDHFSNDAYIVYSPKETLRSVRCLKD